MAARLLLCAVLACFAAAGGAQARWAAPASGSRSAAPAAADSGARWAAPRAEDPQAERCANFRRELRAARSREREAGTTTSMDQTATRRQQIVAQMRKAGC